MTPAAHRIGQPTPLIFHLSAALVGYAQGILAAPAAADPEFPWHKDLSPFEGPAPQSLDVTLEAVRRLRVMVEGIHLWQAHPYRRALSDPPTVWQLGATRVLDYGQTPEATNPQGPIVLVVPSLINRAYILDLMEGNSFLRALAAAGLRPLLLDWGSPGPLEADFDLDDYVAQPLMGALAIAHGLGGKPPALLGYCMGGTLSAGHVLTRGGVRALVTIGAPWDFAAAGGAAKSIRTGAVSHGMPMIRQTLRSLSAGFGTVPVSLFQHLFAMVDPIQAARKFQRFAALPQDGKVARLFVALEDWLADGVPMAGPAAETLLIDWHLGNAPAAGAWPAAARRTPEIPALVVCGARDSIAQPAMAHPLADAFPGASRIAPQLGHVGMITGSAAPDHVWRPVVEFLNANA